MAASNVRRRAMVARACTMCGMRRVANRGARALRPAGGVTSTADSTVLSCEHLRKVYRMGEVDVRALDGVDFALHRGELLVLLGVSGSGKSTLLNILGGLDVPTSGRVFFDEQ